MKTKTNKNRKITSIILALAVAFAYLPAMTNADYGKAAKKPGKVTVKTSKKKPGKVKGLKVVKKGKRSVTLKWRKAKRAKKYIVYKKRVRTKYKDVIARDKNGKKKVFIWDPIKNKPASYVHELKIVHLGKYKKAKTTKKTKVTIKKLKPGQKYRFKVVAKNKAGKGKASKEPKVNFKKSGLTKKEKKQIELLTIKEFEADAPDNSISYRWSNKYSEKRSGVTHYELWYQKKGSKQWKHESVLAYNAHFYAEDRIFDGSGSTSILSKGKYIAKMRACKGDVKGPFSVVRGNKKYKMPFAGIWSHDLIIY